MDPAGKYYLANDITVNTTYASAFTGTFDGNGKTVTVSEPMFLVVSGTVKNLTVKGDIVADHAKSNGLWGRGAVACEATGAAGTTVVFENIVNNANVAAFTQRDTTAYPDLKGYAWAGGIVGVLNSEETSTASVTFTNCVNNGTIKGGNPCGGIIGTAYSNDNTYAGTSSIIITDCVNNGAIESQSYCGGILGRGIWSANITVTGCVNTGLVRGLGNSGGMIGHTTSSILTISFCQNNGEINTFSKDGETPYAGGIIGYAQGPQSDDYSAANGKYGNVIEYCVNTASVTGDARCGGIVGSSGHGDNRGITLVNYCINTGNVTNRGIGTSAAAAATGGIQGYGYGTGDKEYAFITNCISTGNVTAMNADKGIASYFLGYISSKYAKIANCIGMGTLTSAVEGNTFILGWNNKAAFAAESVGNKVPADVTYSMAYQNGDKPAKDATIGDFDATVLASGQIVYEFNQAYKAATGTTEDVLFMTINGTDFAPTLLAADDGSNIVVKKDDGSFANPEKAPEAPETTEPAPETTEPGSSTPTGDSAIVFAAIAAVATLGVAVVAKKREN
jgi:hypothetical protein